MKATSLLEDQHRIVEALLEQLENGQGDPAATIETLANNLAAHMVIEQDIFYPAVRDIDADRVNSSYEEHALTEVALKRLMATDPREPSFKARVIALKEVIYHHVSEEEEELFPQVEESLGDDALAELTKPMRVRFQQVYETGFEAATPKGGLAKTSADVARQALAKHSSKDKSISL